MYHYIIKDGLGTHIYKEEEAEMYLNTKIKSLEKMWYWFYSITPNPLNSTRYHRQLVKKTLKLRPSFTNKVSLRFVLQDKPTGINYKTSVIEIHNIYKRISMNNIEWF